ncbi:Asp-tRNA(Asn)/Glu-tRNA(Gln) amidotransferase subunit GatB [Sulfitobacter dubius]|uniref:Asp-tRNA(Asn)/Glu-tRNA(Gln) amidotransferase subunit GatB n=1 Tax=Sulfitobacter dubius TaxID=218673 RepID=UPI0008EBC317|nr:Asp-tRNA(Asn)/Glu-tRNA(Gln) amidotransferase subunit GatB [Sulfitobacter dubius]SFG51085.1 aspartyl/glutamyl-tRNA(Asn/Gln) amidotransferase subunit B [Sulfitobacter dubius]
MLDLSYDTPKPRVIAGAKHDWELVIGMEVHAQVASNAKLFSGASTQFGAEPNSNVAFVDAAMPGMLPVINEYCVEQAVRTGLGLKAEINLKSAFDRKNYFYPDLPQGYQISQLYEPIVGEGEVLVELGDGTARLVRIERIHMEQDAGKSIHDMDPNMSFVDLNRTGVCLMEIVSRPDIRGPEEAAAYLGKLRQILRYLGTCNGDMQSGAMRADVNVSICRVGQYEKYQETQDFSHLGTRCEIKNMNSMRFIQQAIEVEAKRQIAIVEAGGEVVQETRLFDPDKQETRSMRSKEEAHDYRYFPDPDLLPLEIEQAWVDEIAANLPELPDQKKARFIGDFGLSDYDASVLTADLDSAGYFEMVVAEVANNLDKHDGHKNFTTNSKEPIPFDVLVSRDLGKLSANWVINELFGRLKKEETAIKDSPVAPASLASLVTLIKAEVISGKIAKEVFEITYTTGRDPAEIVETEGLKQVTDTGAIETAVDEIIAANPDQVAKAQQNPKLAGWFVGQVMKATGGKANPKAVNEIVSRKLAQQ